MPEVKIEVKTYLVEYICPECKIGKMEPTEKMFLTRPQPKYEHACGECGQVANFTIKYPYQTLEPVNGKG